MLLPLASACFSSHASTRSRILFLRIVPVYIVISFSSRSIRLPKPSTPISPTNRTRTPQNTTARNHGHPPPHHGRPALDPARQPGELTGKLLPQVLPLPRSLLAAAQLRRRRRLAPAQGALRLPQDRGLRAGQDGGRAHGRRAARAHYELERHEDA